MQNQKINFSIYQQQFFFYYDYLTIFFVYSRSWNNLIFFFYVPSIYNFLIYLTKFKNASSIFALIFAET
jgi:hypothetical protein